MSPDYLVHYFGVLGDFFYDPTEFVVGEDLRFVGKQTGSVVVPDGVKILNHTFSKCKKVCSVSVPDSVTIVGESCFDGCVLA